MDGDGLHTDAAEPELESDLVDLRGVDLEQLVALPETVFARSLRRILEERRSDSASDRHTSFQNTITYEAECSYPTAPESVE